VAQLVLGGATLQRCDKSSLLVAGFSRRGNTWVEEHFFSTHYEAAEVTAISTTPLRNAFPKLAHYLFGLTARAIIFVQIIV
jgi:hypothetical protein